MCASLTRRFALLDTSPLDGMQSSDRCLVAAQECTSIKFLTLMASHLESNERFLKASRKLLFLS